MSENDVLNDLEKSGALVIRAALHFNEKKRLMFAVSYQTHFPVHMQISRVIMSRANIGISHIYRHI